MSFQRFFEKKIGPNRKFVKKLKSFSKKAGLNLEHWERYPIFKQIKNASYLILKMMIVDLEYGFIEVLRLKKNFLYKFGQLPKKIKI
tara:strand:+ start:95 stop:355 length:261 start_codon:yes stop_codon:yes gene_type:complete